MSNEFNIRAGIFLSNGNQTYRASKTGFTANQNDITGTGEVPGGLVVPTAGVDVPFTGLTLPGWCEIENFDANNTLIWGIKDTTTGLFYPIGDVWAQEKVVFRLSAFLKEGLSGTGTHASADVVTFHLKALTAAISAAVRAFET